MPTPGGVATPSRPDWVTRLRDCDGGCDGDFDGNYDCNYDYLKSCVAQILPLAAVAKPQAARVYLVLDMFM